MTFPCSTGLLLHPTCTLRQTTVRCCVGGIVYRRGCLVHQHTQYITLYGLDALDDWLPWTMNLMIIFWISSFGFPSKWKSKIMYVQTQPTAFFEAKHLFSFWGCTHSSFPSLRHHHLSIKPGKTFLSFIGVSLFLCQIRNQIMLFFSVFSSSCANNMDTKFCFFRPLVHAASNRHTSCHHMGTLHTAIIKANCSRLMVCHVFYGAMTVSFLKKFHDQMTHAMITLSTSSTTFH